MSVGEGLAQELSNSVPNTVKDNEGSFKFVDLFAGLGGFHLALERMGGTCVFAAEWKEHLRVLYKTNFGLLPAGDIRSILPHDIPDHDVLTAGFPCQPFSKAGEQLGFECTEQGGLFFEVLNILSVKKPRYFILENVPNLLKHDQGRTWKRILAELGGAGLGYEVKVAKLSPHNFGIPQIRERIYIVGSITSLDEFEWPANTSQETSIDSILEEFPADAKQLSRRASDCINVWQDFIERCPEDVELPWFPLWSMEWGATYPFEAETPYANKILHGDRALIGYKGSHGVDLTSMESVDYRWDALPSHARTQQMIFPKWKQNFIRKNREFYQLNKEWIDPWLSKILEFPSSLQKLEWNAKGGDRNIWQYVLQFRASGVRVKRPTTAPSLIAMTDTQVPIIGWQKRYMTPRECARLQSLEGLKELPKFSTHAFSALGNAVNSNVVEMVARSLIRKVEL